VGKKHYHAKERLRRRLTFVPAHVKFMHCIALHHTVLYENSDNTGQPMQPHGQNLAGVIIYIMPVH